jgi:hypothetical protein
MRQYIIPLGQTAVKKLNYAQGSPEFGLKKLNFGQGNFKFSP